MVKRLLAILGALTVVAALAVPALGVESVSERQARKKAEAQKYPNQASQALQQNDPDKAIDLFTKAINSKAFDGESLGELHFGRGSAYRMKKDCTSAMADFDKALEAGLTDGDLYFSRAACFLETGQDDKALAELDLAVKKDPNALMYRSARCILLFNKKDFAAALPDCEKALAGQPDNKNLLTATSQASEQTGNRARAAELYRKLLEVDPGNPIATEGLKRTAPE